MEKKAERVLKDVPADENLKLDLCLLFNIFRSIFYPEDKTLCK